MNDSLRLLAQRSRAEIEAGALRGAALLELLLSIPFVDRDVWVDELLGLEEPPPDIADLPRGSVPYLPAGVEEILATIQEVPIVPDDEVVDIGSGLGRVAILTHLLTGARARGIEIQAPLVHRANARGAALGLEGVSFTLGNAVDTRLDGSVFFLYCPCNGPMLAGLSARLEEVASRRPIAVCAVGFEFQDVRWLQPRATSSVALTIYDSSVPGVRRRGSRT